MWSFAIIGSVVLINDKNWTSLDGIHEMLRNSWLQIPVYNLWPVCLWPTPKQLSLRGSIPDVMRATVSRNKVRDRTLMGGTYPLATAIWLALPWPISPAKWIDSQGGGEIIHNGGTGGEREVAPSLGGSLNGKLGVKETYDRLMSLIDSVSKSSKHRSATYNCNAWVFSFLTKTDRPIQQ